MPAVTIRLKHPHAQQRPFIRDPVKRKVIRAGRRGGKTTGVGIYAVEKILVPRRILYAAPTQEQVEAFWVECKRSLSPLIDAGICQKNETRHLLELPTGGRIRAKTAWDADSLRGDFADELILDEFQLMHEEVWGRVGAPMLLDNDGNAIFVYTPPSLRSRSISKAEDPRHAAKLFTAAQADTSGRWKAYTFSSHDNPYISADALGEITRDMTTLAYRAEILALDEDHVEGALWTRDMIDAHRRTVRPDCTRIVVAIDPSATSGRTSDEAGIIVAGVDAARHGHVLHDGTLRGSPLAWASRAVALYHEYQADRIVAETNNGGEMVELAIKTVESGIPYKAVHASRGKMARAEPISAKAEKGEIHHIGVFPELEDELCSYVPGQPSPNRLDAMVWAMTELTQGEKFIFL